MTEIYLQILVSGIIKSKKCKPAWVLPCTVVIWLSKMVLAVDEAWPHMIAISPQAHRSYWYFKITSICMFFKRDLFFRERGREGEREGEKHRCARETWVNRLSHVPSQAPGPWHRHAPWPGTELVCGRHPIHWATRAKVQSVMFLIQEDTHPPHAPHYRLVPSFCSLIYLQNVFLI